MANDLSGRNLNIEDIFSHNTDLRISLRRYFSPANPDYVVRFAGDSESEVETYYRERLDELEANYSFSLLASLEASFKIDYLLRCRLKRKDSLSRALRQIYRGKRERASLEDDILEAWKKNTTVPPKVIGDIIGAMKFRHWLAHGRYWPPKLGRRYDFFSVYTLAAEVLSLLPLEG